MKVPALTPPENTPVVAVIVFVTDKFEVEMFVGLNTPADNAPATESSVMDALLAEIFDVYIVSEQYNRFDATIMELLIDNKSSPKYWKRCLAVDASNVL